jgi:ribonuclease P protein subunit POP4
VTPVTATNILRHEINGLEVQVSGDSNDYCININGEVIEETRNTIIIFHKGKSKIVAKKNASFVFNLGESLVEVEGKALIGRPEDRIKKKNKRSW